MARSKKAAEKSEPQHFFSLLKKFDVAMMVTGGGETRTARPMHIAQIDEQGTVWFISSHDAERTRTLETEPWTSLVCQSRRVFLSLSGKARVVRDEAKLDQLWNEAFKVWFPEGRASPDLVLIAVEPVTGEYWDQAGSKGLRYLLQAVKAFVSDEEVKEGPDVHANTPLEEAPAPEHQKGVH